MPDQMVLAAPFTPFKADGSLNATADGVDALAAQAASFGVTTVWVPGSMGQFDALTVVERKALLEAWAPAAKKHGLYLIAHVGSTSIGDATELARHAHQIGAPAIATVPPYYERTSDVPTICKFLAAIGAAAPTLPLFYYHIPGMTGADIKVGELLRLAASNATDTAVPTLAGVKYVSDDLADWFDLVQTFNTTRALMFAPEPKLAHFGLGSGRGVILAEDFFAPTYLRMRAAYLARDHDHAAREQAFKFAASAVIHKYGGTEAERALYRAFPLTPDFQYGPPRLPKLPFQETNWAALHKELAALGFWDSLAPPHYH